MSKVYVKELDRPEGRSMSALEPGNRGDWIKTSCLSYLPGAADHDVVTVAVSDAKYVGGYTVACT